MPEKRTLDLMDQTADADPDANPVGAEELDAGESGDSAVGAVAEVEQGVGASYVTDRVPAPAEEAAMHVIDEDPTGERG